MMAAATAALHPADGRTFESCSHREKGRAASIAALMPLAALLGLGNLAQASTAAVTKRSKAAAVAEATDAEATGAEAGSAAASGSSRARTKDEPPTATTAEASQPGRL